jgi:hypothetical protein
MSSSSNTNTLFALITRYFTPPAASVLLLTAPPAPAFIPALAPGLPMGPTLERLTLLIQYSVSVSCWPSAFLLIVNYLKTGWCSCPFPEHERCHSVWHCRWSQCDWWGAHGYWCHGWRKSWGLCAFAGFAGFEDRWEFSIIYWFLCKRMNKIRIGSSTNESSVFRERWNGKFEVFFSRISMLLDSRVNG